MSCFNFSLLGSFLDSFLTSLASFLTGTSLVVVVVVFLIIVVSFLESLSPESLSVVFLLPESLSVGDVLLDSFFRVFVMTYPSVGFPLICVRSISFFSWNLFVRNS